MRPDNSVPIADPRLAVVTYQAKTSALVFGVVRWLSVLSSMALKGPKSLPVALITPTTAANNNIQKFSNRAKVAPDSTIKTEPPKSTRRRPTRSATSVRDNESSTSPRRVSVMKSPIYSSEKSSAEKKSANIRELVPYANIRVHRERIMR